MPVVQHEPDFEMRHAIEGANRVYGPVRFTAYVRVVAAAGIVLAGSYFGLELPGLLVLAVAALGWAIVGAVNDWAASAQTLGIFTSDRVLDLLARLERDS